MIAQLSNAGAPIPKAIASKAYAVLRESLKGIQQRQPALRLPSSDEPLLPL
ncbi:hypothetical protein GKA01_26800 [Gluconobacter kanchanaburiensis NBRC 103587]|uniref:Uncharacterized protein n=2 Tax=Gluconobacter kanchanaburiensis TaxID=563199 RepID=A0A511BD06_9PROT|nr:hypothetical protein GKA01_26800 [Gluconobacter kanchanaburiensis NBRC 103587]